LIFAGGYDLQNASITAADWICPAAEVFNVSCKLIDRLSCFAKEKSKKNR
jgi:hypothetical protein